MGEGGERMGGGKRREEHGKQREEGRGGLPTWAGLGCTGTRATKARVSMGRQELEVATTGKDQTAVLSILSTTRWWEPLGAERGKPPLQRLTRAANTRDFTGCNPGLEFHQALMRPMPAFLRALDSLVTALMGAGKGTARWRRRTGR